MSVSMKYLVLVFIILAGCPAFPAGETTPADRLPCAIYPEVLDSRPDIPSPFSAPDGQEYLVAVTKQGRYAVVPVTLGDDRDFSPQLLVDAKDFPTLAATGLHTEAELDKLKTITGRPLSEITELGRSGAAWTGFGWECLDEEQRNP